MDLVDETLEMTAAGGEQFSDARLWVAKGNLHLVRATAAAKARNLEAAEAAFLEGVGIARRQEARTLELEAALELSSVYIHQGRKEQAFELVQPLYCWFTQGFDTWLLKSAARLLEELEPGWTHSASGTRPSR